MVALKTALSDVTSSVNKKFVFTLPPLKNPAVEGLVILTLATPILLVVLVALVHSVSYVVVECGPLLHQILLPGLMLLFATSVPLVRTPISALICLLGLFGTSALVYLLAGAEYFANVSFIVSIGGVAIIFLFVIMLLDPKGLIPQQKLLSFDLFYTGAALLGLGLFFRLTANAQFGLEDHFIYDSLSIPTEQELFRAHMETDILIFRSLFGADWALFALITGILLLSMLAAIIIATLSSETHVERTRAVAAVGQAKSPTTTTKANGSQIMQQTPPTCLRLWCSAPDL